MGGWFGAVGAGQRWAAGCTQQLHPRAQLRAANTREVLFWGCARRLGVEFQKKPNDGKMKGLAFIKDPDGYWIEILNAVRQRLSTAAQHIFAYGGCARH